MQRNACKNRGGALPLPKELRKAFGENVQISSLLEVPNKLRLFLAADLKKYVKDTWLEQLVTICLQ